VSALFSELDVLAAGFAVFAIGIAAIPLKTYLLFPLRDS
jgi:hypothetical protein